MAGSLNGRGVGGVPPEEFSKGAADRDRFVREGIPPAVYELCARRARALRVSAFAAAFRRLLELLSIEGVRCGQERSVWSTKKGQSSTTHKSALARTTLSGLTGP